MFGHSGIGTYLRNVLPRVIEANPDLRYRIIGPSDLRREPWAAAPGIAVEESRVPIYTIREQIELPRLTRGGSDLFWAPHYNVPLLHRGPVLATVHDLAHLAVPGLTRGPHRRAYARTMLRAAGRGSGTIFVSRFTAAEYRRILGAPRGEAHVILQGVDGSWFDVSRESPPPERPYLLFVGNVKPHKNLAGLLRAFRLLMDEIPHDLLIVGRREGFIHGSPEVVAAAEEMGGRVRFTGWLSDEEVRQAYSHADLMVFPSFYEGFGLPPLEAMACGCPVAASNRAAIPEVCGEAVLYFDPDRVEQIAAQVRRLLKDPVLRTELVARGREHARGFTWERCAAETGAFIRSLMRS
jgi:glycosyltransferase involved in cell wall biosynthesis